MALREWSQIAVLALGFAPALLAAQELSDAELKRRFEAQVETLRDARAGGGGATRGLVLTPAPVAAEDGNAAEAEPATTAEPIEHWELPKGEQVNIRVNFAFDSAAIEPSQEPKLRQLCGVIAETGIAGFRIIGHTDATGPDGYNQQLSILRAEEVRRFLVNECGIAETRLEAIGVGEQFLFNAANPAADENRRVEFQATS